jgi:hypothetical protein
MVPSHGPVGGWGLCAHLFEACAETLDTLRFHTADPSVGE